MGIRPCPCQYQYQYQYQYQCALVAALLAVLTAMTDGQSSAVGVNIKVPIPILDGLFSSETPHAERWYFWVIIGIIASFMVVMVYFTGRGLMRYRHVYSLSAKQTRSGIDAEDALRRTAPGAHPSLRLKYNPRYAV